MANYLQTKAIVLGHRDLAEHDRLYTLYTEARGKLEVRVRGARKILSKLQPPLSSIAVVRVLIYEGRARPLLIGIETAERLSAVAKSLWRTQAAACFLRLVDISTRPEIRDQELFTLLRDALHMTECIGVQHLSGLRDSFVLKLLAHSGYQPELGFCAGCRLPETSLFSASHGGAVCGKCATSDPTAIPLGEPALLALRHRATLPLAAAAILPVFDLGAVTKRLLQYRLETPLWFPL